MSDIDFDELDKAVNNLMGRSKNSDEVDTSAKDESPLSSDGGRLEVAEEDSSQAADWDDAPEVTEADKPAEHTPKAANSPRRSGGRFMDVVHPSADMRTKNTSGATIPTISKISAPIQPKVDQPIFSGDDSPLTPFLPDANEKVEKRPLGAKSWFSDNSEEKAEDSQLDNEGQANDDTLETDVDVSSAQQAESIEGANGHSHADESEGEKGQDQRLLDPTDYEAVSEEQRKLQEIEARDLTPPSDHNEVVATDTEGEQAGTIYDTNAYHQPLSQRKQKSGWGTVLIIIVVIAVCVGLAVAAYLYLGGNFRLG